MWIFEGSIFWPEGMVSAKALQWDSVVGYMSKTKEDNAYIEEWVCGSSHILGGDGGS